MVVVGPTKTCSLNPRASFTFSRSKSIIPYNSVVLLICQGFKKAGFYVVETRLRHIEAYAKTPPIFKSVACPVKREAYSTGVGFILPRRDRLP